MKRFFATIFAVLAISALASAADYSINDDAVDALIEAAIEISPSVSDLIASAPVSLPSSTVSSVSPVASFILCTFLGGFGIHRHYMGTRPFMWVLYTFTFGGIFGVVPFVDWVFLLIGVVEDNISQYCGNTKFFMWA